MSSASQRSGPIYEDIDRMCTYRGSPPEAPQRQPLQKSFKNFEADVASNYYNVFPVESPLKKVRPDSGGSNSSPHHCGTSSSEVSFDSSSSPRHPQERSKGVIVNPMSSPQHVLPSNLASRVRTMSPTALSERTRSPVANSPFSAKLAGKASSSSVYYYSDTLRPKQNRGFEGSDSGISNNPDTPPQLPSARLAGLATAGGRGSSRGRDSKRKPLPAPKKSADV